jgi:hypothetical protein
LKSNWTIFEDGRAIVFRSFYIENERTLRTHQQALPSNGVLLLPWPNATCTTFRCDSPPVQIDPTKSQQLMSWLSSLYRLPKRSNSVQFVTLSLLSRRVCSFDEQIGKIVDLYEREIADFINGLSPIAR